MSTITIRRIYEDPLDSDGARVLVDRLWPRGVSKTDAQIELWLKEAAPSNELRRWYMHAPSKWPEFKRRYFEELRKNPGVLDPLLAKMESGPVVLIYSSKERELNNAAALKEFMQACWPF